MAGEDGPGTGRGPADPLPGDTAASPDAETRSDGAVAAERPAAEPGRGPDGLGAAHERPGPGGRGDRDAADNLQLNFDFSGAEEAGTAASETSLPDEPAPTETEPPEAETPPPPDASLTEAPAPAETPELRTLPAADQPRVNFRITDDDLGTGGAKTKFNRNVAAIRTLKQIEAEGRLATPEEQTVLSQYVGWGGLPRPLTNTTRNGAENTRS